MYCDWPIFQRCCFCFPLRKGVLAVGYIKLVFSTLMIGLYSYCIHYETSAALLFNGAVYRLPADICLAIYIFEFLFCVLLVYGSHKKIFRVLRIYFYYATSTILMTVLMEIIEIVYLPRLLYIIETIIFSFVGLCLQIYLIMLLWSLLKKLELDGPHLYDNQLHQFVEGQAKVEPNGVYNPSTEPVEV